LYSNLSAFKLIMCTICMGALSPRNGQRASPWLPPPSVNAFTA